MYMANVSSTVYRVQYNGDKAERSMRWRDGVCYFPKTRDYIILEVMTEYLMEFMIYNVHITVYSAQCTSMYNAKYILSMINRKFNSI